MAGSTRRPLVFGIGLPLGGGSLLAALFDANGHQWRHHQSGKLAQSVAYARAAKTQPLSEWPDAVGFSDIFSLHKRHMPALRVQDLIAYLHNQFPDAYFINTHRNPADWVAARFMHDDGEHRIAAAWHAGITESDLAQHWMDEQTQYTALCAVQFAGNPRYLNINVTSQIADIICDFLSPDFDLNMPKTPPDFSVSADTVDAVLSHINTGPAPQLSPPTDMNFIAQVADFCAETAGPHSKTKVLSATAVVWAKNNTVKGRKGGAVPLLQDTDGTYLLQPCGSGLERSQSTLNDLRTHGAKPPLYIDMMDARFLGTADRPTAPRRTVAYNRRSGTPNITLWPLAGYHSLAPRGQIGGFPKDEIPYEKKADRCVWLGNLTGRMSPILTPPDQTQRGVYNIRDEALKLAAKSPDWTRLIADLDCVPRYRIVKTYRDHPDFEVGLVLRAQWKRLSDTPAFKGLCDPKRSRTWFHQFRYILSLAGNDTGSNFLSAASSNALILKEEDGWELFYTDAFKPWVHYVPLTEGALDVEEKLAWARANHEKCETISNAATRLYDKFANPNNRAAYLRAIAAKLNEA